VSSHLAGADVAIVERRASQKLAGSRAGSLHSRTIEVLDQRGIVDRFLAEGQKSAGHRVCRGPFQSQRVFNLLNDARPALLNLGEPGGFDITPWADRVQLIDAKYAGTWELPAIGAVTVPTAVLVRPDGYVAGWQT
jgi:aromatic ring hydroxylase-like protein/FAD binding domain-containing protein